MNPKMELVKAIEKLETLLIKQRPWWCRNKHQFARKVIEEVIGYSPYGAELETKSVEDTKKSIHDAEVMYLALHALNVVKLYR